MKKRLMQLFLVLILAICICVPSNSPALASAAPDVIYQPCFTYINYATCGMDINSSGKASMASTIVAYSGTVDQVRMNNYLQRYQDGSWTTVKSWSQTTEGTIGVWAKSYYVTSGYNYRQKTYFYVYDGSTVIESTSLTSGIVYY